jgi:hypothetical protein
MKIVLGKKQPILRKKKLSKKKKSLKNVFKFWGDLGYRRGKKI